VFSCDLIYCNEDYFIENEIETETPIDVETLRDTDLCAFARGVHAEFAENAKWCIVLI